MGLTLKLLLESQGHADNIVFLPAIIAGIVLLNIL